MTRSSAMAEPSTSDRARAFGTYPIRAASACTAARVFALTLSLSPSARRGTWGGRTFAEVYADEPVVVEAFARGEDVARGGGETLPS